MDLESFVFATKILTITPPLSIWARPCLTMVVPTRALPLPFPLDPLVPVMLQSKFKELIYCVVRSREKCVCDCKDHQSSRFLPESGQKVSDAELERAPIMFLGRVWYFTTNEGSRRPDSDSLAKSSRRKQDARSVRQPVQLLLGSNHQILGARFRAAHSWFDVWTERNETLAFSL